VPKLWKGACVVMDNGTISLGEEVKKALKKTGARLIYLSPYSPDFSPIENRWSQLEIILRSIKTTNSQELGKAIEFAFGSALHRQILLTGLHTAVIVPHFFEKGYTFTLVRVRKTRPVVGFDIACKWKRNYQGLKVKEAWFILTDLGSLPVAISAYKKRMGIEEMFRDCKTGGYNLEGSGLRGDRLVKIILLMAIVYSSAIFQGTEIHKKQVQKYVSRRKEKCQKYRRRSIFGIGQDGEQWVNYLD